jgi:hypothetical protein
MTNCARILLTALAASALAGCSNYLTLPPPPMYVWPQVNQTYVQYMALTPADLQCRQAVHASCRKVPAGKAPILSPPHAP